MWNMMNDGTTIGAMHWGMGLIGTLVVVVLVLGAVALAKYIFTRQTSAGMPPHVGPSEDIATHNRA